MANKPDRQASAKRAAKPKSDEQKSSLGKPNKGNDPLKVSHRDETEAEREARQSGTRATGATPGKDSGSRDAFVQTRPGDRLEMADDEELLNRSQAYRDKYSEVMRDYYAGQLRGKTSNMIIKDASEARAMAREQAAIADAQSLG